MNDKVIITNIQRMCLHDGEGIRTTIFLKGCTIHCPWCANPETIKQDIQYFVDKRICRLKNCKCCPYNSSRSQQSLICRLNAIKNYGYSISNKELFTEIMKDVDFFDLDGGVTFSGGEPLLQINKYEWLLKKLKKEKVNITFETALFVPNEFVQTAMKYTDNFIVDIKILEKEKCKEVLHGNIEQYLYNVKTLFQKQKHVVFRFPMSNEYTLTKENLHLLINFLEKYRPVKIEIFKLHSLAKNKYENLNMDQMHFSNVESNSIENLVKSIEQMNIKVEILKI